MKRTTLRNAGLWVAIAVLFYFNLEMIFDWEPIEIIVGDLIIPVRIIVFFMVTVFIAVRLYFVLRKQDGQVRPL